MSEREQLRRLAERSRALLDELDLQRQDVLSVTELNRTLRQVLRNQVALLEAVALAEPGRPLTIRAQPRPAEAAEPVPAGPSESAARARPCTPFTASPAVDDDEGLEVVEEPRPAPGLGGSGAVMRPHGARNGSLNGSTQAAQVEGEPASDPSADGGESLAVRLLDERRHVPAGLARVLIEVFDNRDNDYAKGLDKMNRWVAGGAGTPFQWRGDRAYLNLNGVGPQAVKGYEEQLMVRMGFSRRLGRLVVPGLDGEIVVYERPS